MSKEKELQQNRYIIPDDEFPISYLGVEINIKELAGKILTIIDASISDKVQNKAIKDLIKVAIKERLFYFQDMCFKGNKGQSIQLPE